ncbi:MAG: glycine cleavage system aminomethyltransferase GcvT [Chitinispirillales bacterium]|jgi:aminomethyltransferase|nr:glycine cleavage system aminomethyltransferase GcvT [Chitinispirillales bacterium]
MKKTVLHDLHVSRKAKMMPFGGYDMPMQYEGIIKEHEAARTGAAVFDTCHMGEFRIGGAGALGDLENILSCDVSDLAVGACRYGFMCNDSGGVIDDLIIYRIAEESFMTVVNAATAESDFEWIRAHISKNTSLENISAETAKIDINGPKSPHIVAALMKEPIDELKFFRFMNNFYKDTELIVSRTGYTGEIGFEVYCPVGIAVEFWNDCVDHGATPAGLGSRDTLRIEMGYPLYGHELSADRNASQPAFARSISKKKGFIGSKAVLNPPIDSRILCGISIDGRRTARHGDTVKNNSGKDIGIVTSGSYSPTLGHAIAMAYIDKGYENIDTILTVVSEKYEVVGKVCQLPFYKKSTGRADIKLYLS